MPTTGRSFSTGVIWSYFGSRPDGRGIQEFAKHEIIISYFKYDRTEGVFGAGVSFAKHDAVVNDACLFNEKKKNQMLSLNL